MSLYTYRVINRGIEHRDFNSYLKDKFKATLINKLEYHNLVQLYFNLFRKENILFLAYEQFDENYKRFIDEMLSFINAPNRPKIVSKKVNTSSQNEHIVMGHKRVNQTAVKFFKYCLNIGLMRNELLWTERYFKFKGYLIHPALTLLYGSAERKIDFSPDWKKTINYRFTESNKALDEMTDIDLARYGYPIA